jgi:hypothetical protein
MEHKRATWRLAVLALTLSACSDGEPKGVAVGEGSFAVASGVEVSGAVQQDLSPPLVDLPPGAGPTGAIDGSKEHPVRPFLHTAPGQGQDTVVQTVAVTQAPTSAGFNFPGVGNGDYGFRPDSAPPDTDGDVGPNHYVQIVNESFAVFSKTGALIYGPVRTNTVWSGFGGGCQTNDDGDATVKYDRAADRWIITQFSVSTKPYLQCVAISQTGDPTGAYYRYAFQYQNFPDYPKLGVWPDAYYVTFNSFNGNSFVGSRICAYDRNSMLQGLSATQQCFQLSSSFGGLLPSDVNGSTPPPAGSPNYLLNLATSSLNLWTFHVDWPNSANSSLTGPSNIATAPFTLACNGGVCIPQPGTRNRLDSLGDRLMYRLAYRNLGSHEALVVNHSVTAGHAVGVRWYELRPASGAATIFQQGTFAPDANYRWMGSIAMDASGDIALGYSVSSAGTYPGIRYTSRQPGDPLGTLAAESTLLNGAGAQTGNLHRWGDYSSMSVDPSDDCTFWYTNQYLKANGSFNWSTRIGSFKFAGCTATTPP